MTSPFLFLRTALPHDGFLGELEEDLIAVSDKVIMAPSTASYAEIVLIMK